jgi:hypothetical protein
MVMVMVIVIPHTTREKHKCRSEENEHVGKRHASLFAMKS